MPVLGSNLFHPVTCQPGSAGRFRGSDQEAPGQEDAGPAGREAEVARIRSFVLASGGTSAGIVISGAAGIGKSVVWKHVVRAGRRDRRVLACCPAPAEKRLPYSALDDLFGAVIGEVLPLLPAARRRALETTLLRGGDRDPGGEPPWPARRDLAWGVLDALRGLAADSPVLLAVDGAQWLDRPSASVLEFCLRRLEQAAVSVLVTCRGAGRPAPLGLDRALPSGRLAHVPLGGLSQDVIGGILRSRLGASFSRHTLGRLHEACGGNPWYALETGRALLERGQPWPADEPIPVPGVIGDRVRSRLRGLSPEALRVSRLVAASSRPREQVIRRACGEPDSWVAIDRAIDDGIIERDGERLRLTHPLLRGILTAEMTAGERRDAHRRLAASVIDPEEQAWHLALSAEGPCDEVAAALDRAAGRAASRGAPEAAAILAEQAMRLTPAAHVREGRERTQRAADYHFLAGELGRCRELAEGTLADCPAGPPRAALLIRLATVHYHQSGWSRAEPMFREAAREAAGDPALRAHAGLELALARLAAGDLPGATRWAESSLRPAEQAGRPGLVARSLAWAAALDVLQGRQPRAEATGSAGGPAEGEPGTGCGEADEPADRLAVLSPALLGGLVLTWRDRLDEGRRELAGCYRQALGRGDKASLPFLLGRLSELECWAGNWEAAAQYAMDGCTAASESRQQAMRAVPLRALALVRAHQGQTDEAAELAGEALALGRRSGNATVRSGALSVLGFIALSLGDHEAAHARLGRLAGAVTRAGMTDPGVLRFLPDEIEALAALGEIGLARSHAAALHAQGRSGNRAWALAAAARCRAHLAGVLGDNAAAQAACQQALAALDGLAMPFELGRTLLIKGITERRARQKSAAADSFGQALSVFERLGAPLWTAKARQELSKVATRPLSNGLTETQRRVAALITQGRTNREIASAMFVTENTVQTHVRHIFQKLGVRSRTELAARLLAPSPPAPRTGPDTSALAGRPPAVTPGARAATSA